MLCTGALQPDSAWQQVGGCKSQRYLATICWASLVAAGLGTVFATFPTAYRALQLAGAAYLIWLGVNLLRSVLQAGAAGVSSSSRHLPGTRWGALRAGFLTNIS